MVVTAEPQIKGFALRGLLKYVKESSYPGGIPALLDTLDDADREYFAEKILSPLWYPYRAFSVLARAIDRELAKGDVDVLKDVGKGSGLQDLGGVFKFVKVILTGERIVNRAPAFWRRYCDRGQFDVIDSGPGHFTVRLSDFPEIDEAHCHMMTGWMFGLAEGTKATNVDVDKTHCVHRGDPYCEYHGTWS